MRQELLELGHLRDEIKQKEEELQELNSAWVMSQRHLTEFEDKYSGVNIDEIMADIEEYKSNRERKSTLGSEILLLKESIRGYKELYDEKAQEIGQFSYDDLPY